MPEVLTRTAEGKTQKSERPATNRTANSIARSLFFKYYIHDSVPTLRFQLIGDLRASNVLELNGSWETARTTLNQRRFLLDASQLYSADDEGRAWLLKMKDAGAQFLPASYLDSDYHQTVPHSPERVEAVKLSLLGRVLGLFRGDRSSA